MMEEFEFDRFEKSESCVKNEKTNIKKNSRNCGLVSVVGLLTLLACAGILFVLHTDQKEDSFDDLITTGGAVRRSLSNNFPKCNTTECQKVKKYVQDSLSVEKVNPCENFYKYACAGWIRRNPIPVTSSTYSTFTKLNQKVEGILHKILTSKVKNEREMMKRTKAFFQSCMDQRGPNGINKKGKKPMMDLIKQVGGWDMAGDNSWNSSWNITATLLNIHRDLTSSGGPLFSIHVSDDPRHANDHILEIDQAGPSLPREIYLSEDSEKLKTLKAYKEYLIDVATLLGAKGDIKKKAEETIAFEKKLAEISVPDDVKQETWFHKMTMQELENEVPNFNWHTYVNEVFKGRSYIAKNESIIAPSVAYLKKMMSVVESVGPDVLSNYVVWSVIQDEVPYLSEKFLKARMHYKEKVLGSKGLRKRWKTCVSYTNEYLGEIIARTYTEKHFKESTKLIATNMITNIREAFKDNVKTLHWMDEVTKARVAEKADSMKDQVGYPSYINNDTRFDIKYKDLKIVSDDLFHNRLSLIKFAHNRMLNKLRKKVDKSEWPMDPQTINAMYSFNQNGMIIPAGILQPPFFHGVNLSMAMLYGAIGSILGHELTHGFDNTGRKFNKKGELSKQWWTNQSLVHFKKRAQCIVDQYSKYKIRGKYPLNGKLTLGENIADNGGFKTALKAYYNWVKTSGGDNLIEGLDFNNEQLFHIAFAQAYCSNSRPSEQYLSTLNDRHSEEEFRVIGTLSNSKEFSKAFNCPIGSRMNPKNKCSVWTVSDE
ncbi:endothelin-converting enzyme homolog isoform X2 [Hydra vulgaris]|uniref:Endothelin-converting enzyme homolog isoform X2 n=1 Tax=Hydra vulgaris TaxID=6087 RepID=A0ABM4D2T8_HYDVU